MCQLESYSNSAQLRSRKSDTHMRRLVLGDVDCISVALFSAGEEVPCQSSVSSTGGQHSSVNTSSNITEQNHLVYTLNEHLSPMNDYQLQVKASRLKVMPCCRGSHRLVEGQARRVRPSSVYIGEHKTEKRGLRSVTARPLLQ